MSKNDIPSNRPSRPMANEIDVESMAEHTANPSRLFIGDVPTPKEIKAYLDRYVIGQEEAKKTLAVAVYNHYKKIKIDCFGEGHEMCKKYKDINITQSNAVILGNTGTGKTFMIKKIAEMLNVPFHIADATTLTEAGYVGDDVENILTGLLIDADYDIDRAQYGIICIDEIDKIAKKGENMSITRDVSGEGVQQSLLKIVEGTVANIAPNFGRKHPQQQLIPFDTTNVMFIAMGAFVGLEDIIKSRLNTSSIGFNISEEKRKVGEGSVLKYVEANDLKRFGIIPELIGRFPVITSTNPLGKDDLVRIMKESKESVLKQYQKLFAADGIELIFKDDAVSHIAELAYRSNTGARGLKGIIEKALLDIMFEFGGSDRKKVVINKSYVEKHMV